MSKRTGNFITLADAVKRYSSDGMRFALADAGDSIEDPNFTTSNADNAILRLHTFVEWCQEMVNEKSSMSTGPVESFAERLFEATINNCIFITDEAYERMLYQKTMKVGFFDIMQARDQYRRVVLSEPDGKLNYDLIHKFIKTVTIICAPVISHTSEYIWKNILQEAGSVFDTQFPKVSPEQVDKTIISANDYLNRSITTFRSKIGAHTRPPKKKDQPQNPYPTVARIYIAATYPDWHQQLLTLLNRLYTTNNNILPETSSIASHIMKNEPELAKQMKKVMAIVSTIGEEVREEGASALLLTMPFNELDVLSENVYYLQTTLKLEKITIYMTTDMVVPESQKSLVPGRPGKPLIFFDKPQ